MSLFFAVIAILAVVGLVGLVFSQPRSQGQQEHSQGKTADGKQAANQGAPDSNQNPEGGTNQKETANSPPIGWWGRFVTFVEGHDRFFNVVNTFLIAAFTVALVVATILLWISHDKLWTASKDAANAAKQSADVAKNTLLTQRPFVFLSGFSWVGLTDDDGTKANVWRIIPDWENSGNLPTKNLLTRVNWQPFDEKGMPSDFDFPDKAATVSTPLIGAIADSW